VINLSYLKVWQEYFASKFIKASALKSFKDQVLVPEVKMMVMPNENRHRASWFIVSKILPLNQFPGNSEKGEHFVSPGKYSEIMAASLKKSNFVPFNYFILPFAIIAPCDHPGPSYTNLGFVKDMLVLCDFGIGFGETPRYPLKQNIFEPENFLADLDCMRGINHDKKLGKMAITALEDFKRGDVMSENYHIGVAVFCQYTSFDTILKSPILSEDQIRSLISVNFGSEKDRQMTNVKDLQKLQGIYIKGATARAAAARELQEVSGILIKDLSPHNIFPSAQRLMEFAEKIGKKKIAEMPDLERRKVIDELVKESGLEEVASEYQDKIKQKPFPKNSSSSKSVSTPLPTIQTSKAKKLQEEDLLKRGDGVFDRS
jgi:hypothetical protein